MTAGRPYNLTRPRVSTTTAITIMQVKTPATTGIEVVGFEISNSSSTTAAMASIQLIQKTAAATVTAQSPAKMRENDVASLCVSGTTATGITASGEGTDGVIYYEQAFNIIDGLAWYPPEDLRVRVAPASFVALKFPAAPSATFSAVLYWIELA